MNQKIIIIRHKSTQIINPFLKRIDKIHHLLYLLKHKDFNLKNTQMYSHIVNNK
jgi:hypothetical protein